MPATDDLRVRDEIEPAVSGPVWRRRILSTASVLAIVLGLVVGTASIAAGYAAHTLADTDGFVATFEPLADDPQVQAVVAQAVTDAVEQAVDIPQLTSEVFDAIRGLGIPERAATALSLLEGPTVQGLRSLVGNVVRDVIASPAFAEVWEQTLRVSHSQLVSTLRGDAGQAFAIGAEGELELHLGPIIDVVKTKLLDDGVAIAGLIPGIDQSIVLVEDASLGGVATAYGLLVGLAGWLPWLALALIATGVLMALHRRRALLTTSVLVIVIMVVLSIAVSIGRTIMIGHLVGMSGPLTPGAGKAVYDVVTSMVVDTALWISLIAVAVGFGAWAAGPGRAPAMLRAQAQELFDAVRDRGATRPGLRK